MAENESKMARLKELHRMECRNFKDRKTKIREGIIADGQRITNILACFQCWSKN